MPNENFHELAGRIEGVSRALIRLATMLEEAELIDGPRYTEALRTEGTCMSFEQPHRLAAQRTLQELAQVLEDDRTQRQELER